MYYKDYLEKVYNELFKRIIVKEDFMDWYSRYFENQLWLYELTIDDIIEQTAFFWKNRDTICKNLARNDVVLKMYWIIE